MFRATLYATLALPTMLFAATLTETLSPDIPALMQNGDTTYIDGDIFPLTPGASAVPLLRHRILLPPSVNEASITVAISSSDTIQLPGKHTLSTIGEDSEEREYEPQPTGLLYEQRIGRYRQARFLELLLSPTLFDSSTGTLSQVRNINLSVSYNETRATAVPLSSRDAEKLRQMTDNNTLLDSYGAATRGAGAHLAIVTTAAISGQLSALQPFIAAKKARGFTVSLITEEKWGGGSGDASAENLRSWLEANYLTLGIDYLLLIGDPTPASGNIAMKTAHSYYMGKKAATDYYFSDLTGNWDADGDGKYGELDDLKKTDGIDAIPDVVVGRIPHYGDSKAVDYILTKTIAYEATPKTEAAWRENMLLVMDGYYGSEGDAVGEAIKDDLSGYGWDFYRMYSTLNNDPDEFSITEEGVTAAWTSGTYGVVTWLTHGKETAAQHIMNNSYAAQLTDDNPAFVMMGSCLNGKPDVKNNLAYTILKKGAIGVVSGSETTIFRQPMGDFRGSSYNHGFIHGFTTLLTQKKPLVGDALSQTKEQADMGCWKNYCAFNLYGDPTVGLGVCDVPTAAVDVVNASQQRVSIGIAGSTFSIEGAAEGSSVALFTVQGKQLFTGVLTPQKALSLPKVAAGHYIAQVQSEGVYHTKLVTVTE